MRRADEHAARVANRSFRTDRTRDAEVHQQHSPLRSFEHDVGGLQVAMDNAGAVRGAGAPAGSRSMRTASSICTRPIRSRYLSSDSPATRSSTRSMTRSRSPIASAIGQDDLGSRTAAMLSASRRKRASSSVVTATSARSTLSATARFSCGSNAWKVGEAALADTAAHLEGSTDGFLQALARDGLLERLRGRARRWHAGAGSGKHTVHGPVLPLVDQRRELRAVTPARFDPLPSRSTKAKCR